MYKIVLDCLMDIYLAPIKRCCCLGLWLSLCVAFSAQAATYNLTSGSYPPCNTSWSVSGTTYTCTGNGRVTLASGDILTASTTINIVANNGFSLNNNTIGSALANINLTSSYGTIVAAGTNTIFGALQGGSGAVTLVESTVSGAITTSSNINLTGGSVAGLVTTTGNTITTNNTSLSAGARAQSGMTITGGVLSGAFVMTSNNPLVMTNVVMTSGSISGASTVSIAGSKLGSSAATISITSTSGAVSLSSTTVYGNLTAPNYSTINVSSGSLVTGNCLPNSTPANACNVAPVCTTGLIGGLVGNYFNNRTLTGSPAGTRIDNSVNFDWGSGATGVAGVATNNFSVRWTGFLRAPTTGNYQFQTASDDGVRLWVNNLLVINNWTDHAVATNTSANVSLVAGQSYPVTLEFYENGGLAVMKLNWKIPAASLFTAMNTQAGVIPNTSSSCGAATVAGYTVASSGTGITCAGEPITFTAVDSSGTAIAPPLGTNVTLSTSPATGSWVGGNTFSFNGTVNSFTKYLQQTTPAALTLTITDGTRTGTGAINFVNSALKFYSDASGSLASATMANQVAGTLNGSPIVKAIRTDTVTGACVAQTTGTRSVNMAYVCRNPIACISGQTFTVNGTAIQANANANLASPSYLPVSLNFNGSGIASIPLNYSDVGQIRLLAQLNLSASGNDPAISLAGSSNDFVVKPATLVASSIQSNSATPNPAGTTGTFATSAFLPGGTPFQVSVEARNSSGQRTPNFGNESPVNQNNIVLSNLALVYPASGGVATPLTGTSSFSPTTPAGTFINSNVIWDQVGSFTVQPRLADNDYLGAGDITPTTSPTIGRFYPDHYTLKPTSLVINNCAASPSLIYMGQPAASWSYTLEAQGITGTVMQNYGLYGNPVAKPYGVAENANDGVNRMARLSAATLAIDSGVWVQGVWSPTSPGASFDRAATPDAPLSSLQLGLGVTDSFDSRSLSVKDMNVATTTACSGASCAEIALGAPWDVRFGRLRLDDAFGPETHPLLVNFVTEYWTGNYFAVNANDSCTQVLRTAITYPAGAISIDDNRTVNLTGGSTQGTYISLSPTHVGFNAGSAGQQFTSPNGGTGEFEVGVNLTDLPWLRFDWDQNGDYSDVSLPNATFNFGSYRGHDRIIYWRERLQ